MGYPNLITHKDIIFHPCTEIFLCNPVQVFQIIKHLLLFICQFRRTWMVILTTVAEPVTDYLVEFSEVRICLHIRTVYGYTSYQTS